MKQILLAGVAVLALSGAADAQSCGGCGYAMTTDLVNICATCCWSNGCPSYVVTIGNDHLTGCDSNDKTPSEAIDCKIKYWRAETDRAQKRVDEEQKLLDHAKERAQAFENAKGK